MRRVRRWAASFNGVVESETRFGTHGRHVSGRESARAKVVARAIPKCANAPVQQFQTTPTLFKHPRVLARHRGGPAADARERFLIHRANEGMAHNTLLRTASELLVIAKHIDVTTGTAIGIHEVEIAAAQWSCQQRRRDRAYGPTWPRESVLFNFEPF